MARRSNKKTIVKTEVVKSNIKRFNKEIKDFNARLKKAFAEKKINPTTYMTLLIDKPKKDFYSSNIYGKKQFNDFIAQLKRANKKTLQDAKKGIGDNLLIVSKYERDLYNRNFKYLDKYDRIYDSNYIDLAMNVNKMSYEKLFRLLPHIKYVTKNRSRKFKEGFEKAYKKVFNEDIEIDLNESELRDLIDKNPNFRIDLIYEEAQDKDTRREIIKDILKNAKLLKTKKKKKPKKKKVKNKEQEEDNT